MEAQSISALEGTYAPLEAVLGADEDDEQPTVELREIVNYIVAAEHAFESVNEGRPINLGFFEDLQGWLVRGRRLTPTKRESSEPCRSRSEPERVAGSKMCGLCPRHLARNWSMRVYYVSTTTRSTAAGLPHPTSSRR